MASLVFRKYYYDYWLTDVRKGEWFSVSIILLLFKSFLTLLKFHILVAPWQSLSQDSMVPFLYSFSSLESWSGTSLFILALGLKVDVLHGRVAPEKEETNLVETLH